MKLTINNDKQKLANKSTYNIQQENTQLASVIMIKKKKMATLQNRKFVTCKDYLKDGKP